MSRDMPVDDLSKFSSAELARFLIVSCYNLENPIMSDGGMAAARDIEQSMEEIDRRFKDPELATAIRSNPLIQRVAQELKDLTVDELKDTNIIAKKLSPLISVINQVEAAPQTPKGNPWAERVKPAVSPSFNQSAAAENDRHSIRQLSDRAVVEGLLFSCHATINHGAFLHLISTEFRDHATVKEQESVSVYLNEFIRRTVDGTGIVNTSYFNEIETELRSLDPRELKSPFRVAITLLPIANQAIKTLQSTPPSQGFNVIRYTVGGP